MPANADRKPVSSGLPGLEDGIGLSPPDDGPTAGFDCQACGACCSYSAQWPRFSTEDDAQLDRIPPKYVSADETGMRCDGVRCSALCGEIGKSTSCGVYEVRPDVCRACMPGGDDCLMARRAYGLPLS